ncbi:MAG: hypothetical protein LPK28_06835, partial [Bacteroidota bacterium]|nr:hypothetical protein [Bacteroidota bacterium]
MDEFNQFDEQGGSSYDFQETFRKILGAWPFILATFLLGLTIALLVNRYVTRKYETSGIMMLNQETNSNSGVEALMTKIGYYNPRLEFENEVIYLNSYQQALRTVKELPFEVAYYAKGTIKTSEYYPASKYKVVFDKSHPQPVGSKFSFIPRGKEGFELKPLGSVRAYDFQKNEFVDSLRVEFNSGIFLYNQWIEGPGYRFLVEPL